MLFVRKKKKLSRKKKYFIIQIGLLRKRVINRLVEGVEIIAHQGLEPRPLKN